ncbi:MAG TPA: TSUP family transporter [Bacteroidia bacterium]|nr:TSUP family transporter [Bacteroidia bacterium]
MKTSENKLFPVFLKLEKFRVLIVGGGKVALEKVTAVLQNSPATQITLVGTTISEEITAIGKEHSNLTIHQRPFRVEDLNEKDFVIVAVNNKETSKDIRLEAAKRKIITNVADTPEQCDFYLGSIVQKGNVKIAVSTNGKSPTMAKRIKETLDENFPEEIDGVITNFSKLRTYLSGDFAKKVRQLNDITLSLSSKEAQDKKKRLKKLRFVYYSLLGLAVFITGYLLSVYVAPKTIGGFIEQIDLSQWKYALIGLTAEVINGTLGMAYGVTTTTLLLSSGVAPAFTIIVVHILEVFTAGSTGLIHYKLGNVNNKLFRKLLLPGIIGALIGAYLLYSFKSYSNIIKPAVSVYTLALGVLIIYKAVRKIKKTGKIKRLFPLGIVAGFLDAIGGGGWGTIVSSTLIAGGRNPRYTIGSVILTRFFVALASSISLVFLIGFTHWSIILWLVLGGLVGSPVGPYLTKYIPVKVSMILVAITVIVLSLKQILF